MAADPKARRVTVTYPKGHVTASIGLFDYLVGNLKLQWQASSLPPTAPGKPRRAKYGRKQRNLALGGKTMTLRLATGDDFQVRYAGAALDFIDWVLAKAGEGKVLSAWTERGTIYGPQFPEP